MAQRNEILVIATGGTIVSPKKGAAAAPDREFADAILGRAKEYFDAEGFAVTALRPFGESGIDSSDMGPVQWVRLAAEISSARSPRLRGVLITHGTDTMAYTASWLSICFPGEDFPIILTGSQQSPDDMPFDGENNLLGAAKLATRRESGVGIYFDWKLYDGRRAHKSNCEAIDAYRSIGGACLTYHEALMGSSFTVQDGPGIPKDLAGVLALDEGAVAAAARKVALCFALPGSSPCLRGDEEILILVGYGAGNMPSAYHDALAKTYGGGRKPCVIACSQAEEGRKKPGAYQNVGIGGLSGQGFAVFNQGTATLEYITALAYYAALAQCGPESALAGYLEKL